MPPNTNRRPAVAGGWFGCRDVVAVDGRFTVSIGGRPAGITAAVDLYGTDTVQAARDLGVPDRRITTIAAQVDGITPANGANAAPGAIEEIARQLAAGQIRVPIAAAFPLHRIRAAVELQAGRHVHGKVVIDLDL